MFPSAWRCSFSSPSAAGAARLRKATEDAMVQLDRAQVDVIDGQGVRAGGYLQANILQPSFSKASVDSSFQPLCQVAPDPRLIECQIGQLVRIAHVFKGLKRGLLGKRVEVKLEDRILPLIRRESRSSRQFRQREPKCERVGPIVVLKNGA